jgi:hypothetical protein
MTGVRPARWIEPMSLASLLNDPKHWQDRAAQAEALADQISDVAGKATALSIAEDYAPLGRRAEKRPLVRLGGAETGERASNPAAGAQSASQAVRAARLVLSGRSIMPITYLVVAAIVGIVAFRLVLSGSRQQGPPHRGKSRAHARRRYRPQRRALRFGPASAERCAGQSRRCRARA